ncbi:MAG: hypothetical protein NC913_03025 [Candidatus Omnitrophica bacterium]|nr:hypothetical protein [Candidatus Omnitrophota bacterium]
MSNLKQIGLALRMYSQDYDESFPYIGGNTGNEPRDAFCLLFGRVYGTSTSTNPIWQVKPCPNYLKNTDMLVCPSSNDVKYTGDPEDVTVAFAPSFDVTASNCSYAYGCALDEQTNIESVLAADKVYGKGNDGLWSGIVTVSDANDNHGKDGVNVLYVSGSVQWVAADRNGNLPAEKLGGGQVTSGTGLRNP